MNVEKSYKIGGLVGVALFVVGVVLAALDGAAGSFNLLSAIGAFVMCITIVCRAALAEWQAKE